MTIGSFFSRGFASSTPQEREEALEAAKKAAAAAAAASTSTSFVDTVKKAGENVKAETPSRHKVDKSKCQTWCQSFLISSKPDDKWR